jgi:hypothetical protein
VLALAHLLEDVVEVVAGRGLVAKLFKLFFFVANAVAKKAEVFFRGKLFFWLV